ncbi:MAG: hypothetical protein AAFX93_11505 [Verrucomicrobiota bacterium]
MKFTRFLTWLLVTLSVGALSAQEKVVSIYLEPDANGTVYFQETMTNINEFDPKPVLDGSGAGQGWMFVHYPGRYVGYVQDSDLGPTGSTVRDGAKAYLRPSTTSPVLTVILDGDEAEVARREGAWATVYFQGKAPAYFRIDDDTPVILASTAPAATLGTAAEPAPAPDNAPILEEVVMEEAVLPVSPPSTGTRPPSQTVARYVQGIVKPVTAWDRLWGSDYEYRLVDSEGDTLAYLVMDNTILFGPVETYWGKRVEVTGTVRRISGSVPFEIQAGNIRILR